MEKLNGLIFSKYPPHCAMANGVTAELLVRMWCKGVSVTERYSV